MDKNLLEKFLKLTVSENDSDAVMGLRGAQNLFRDEGACLETALLYAAENADKWARATEKTIDQAAPAPKATAPAAVNISGVPECRAKAGAVEIVLSGKAEGDVYLLPGEAANHAEMIAAGLKDAIVAAIINRSRFKLKLLDNKNAKGEIVETVLRAEYERVGMTPVPVWALANRGEVAAVATLLRKAIATSLPELAVA
jgi:hypothetical protein